jgi:Zn-dependent protease
MGGTSWRVGKIAGVDIFVQPSLLLIAAFLVLTRWSDYSTLFPGESTALLVGLTVTGALLFFGSILAHELGHALVSKARHIPVKGITLVFFGGYTESALDSRGPIDEFLVSVVGPLTNAALAVVFLLLRNLMVPSNLPLAVMFHDLFWINRFVAVLNLIPGFPLDGGRVLRSIVWGATHDRARATRVAGRVGQAVAVAMIAWSVVWMLRSENFSYLWFIFIGAIIFSGASAALNEAARERRLRGLTAGDLMSAPPPAVPPDMPIGEATSRYLAGHEGEAFPVVEGGKLLGFVSPRTARAAASDATVREAMAAPNGVLEAARTEPMDVLTARLGRHGVHAVLVFDDDQLVGVIEPEDLRRFFREHV